MIFWLWTFQLRLCKNQKGFNEPNFNMVLSSTTFSHKNRVKEMTDFVHLFLKLGPNFRDFTPFKNFDFDHLILLFYCPDFLYSAENSKAKFLLRMQRQFRMINCGKKQPCGQCKKYQKGFAMIAVINSEFQEIFFTVQLYM